MSAYLAGLGGIYYSYPLINVIAEGLYFIENVCFSKVSEPPGQAMSAYLARSGGLEYSYPLINVIAVGMFFIEHVSFSSVSRAVRTGRAWERGRVQCSIDAISASGNKNCHSELYIMVSVL